jgi:hypothetical protein
MGLSRAVSVVTALAVCMSIAGAQSSQSPSQTAITVWSTPPPPISAYGLYGGISYGGTATPGAMITERREIDVGGGKLEITGVAATVDPATVQLRSLTDPGGLAIGEQRFVPGAGTPDEILARHVGDHVTVITPKGELTGVLRAVDSQAIVMEVGTGDARRLQILRRDGYVQDIRLPAGKGVDKPSLLWRLAARRPGKHKLEVTYRADGLSWTADYLAIFDESARTIDFSAWATLRNMTGTSFERAELTLVTSIPGPATHGPYGSVTPRTSSGSLKLVVPSPVSVGHGESVQVELVPPRVGAKARSIIAFEAVQDLSATYQGYPATDCSMLNVTTAGSSRAEIAVELDLQGTKQLPDGRVRLFKRSKGSDRLEVLAEEQLRTSAGAARIRLAAHTELTGERRTSNCVLDERARTLSEKVEVRLENKAKQPVDVVVREFMWRFPVWRIDAADESIRGTRVAPQTQEYRVSVPAGARKTVSYTVHYSGWQL